MVPSSLSRLTDDEAKHVWQVIQRDFNLRKKEEDRLGELKTKLKKEDTKRELLVFQPKLSDSLCIRCLQPFKFLVNSKRQCLDCKLFVCKSCSRFNKTEHGWVCDPCHMARILKIGTLEWFHENVRSRFKRFGSAKVMNLLIKRLNGDRACSLTDLREHRDDDTHSMPEVHNGSLYSQADEESECADRRHSLTRKARRLLPVHPLDFNLVIEKCDYSQPDFFLYADSQEKITKNRCSVTEENCSKTFKQIMENGTHCSSPRSLSKMSFSSAGSTNYHLHHELSNSLDDSEDEDSQMQVIYSPALQREPSPEIIELEKRMSAIETLLVHLEQKMFSVTEGTVEQAETKEEDVADLEELELRKKLDELTDKISDEGLSSDEDDVVKPEDSSKKRAVYSSAVTHGALAGPLEIKEWNAQPDVHKSLKNQRRLSPFDLSNTTSCELSQLEGKVAMAAASVQSTQSGVTDIQKRLAALGAAGMTVETSRRQASLQPSNVLHEFPIRASNETRKLSIM